MRRMTLFTRLVVAACMLLLAACGADEAVVAGPQVDAGVAADAELDGSTDSQAGADAASDVGDNTDAASDAGSGGDSAAGGDANAGQDSQTSSDTGGADAPVIAEGTLCNPCNSSSECATGAQPDAKCVQAGPSGAFCGVACAADADCPSGYSCQDGSSIEGEAGKQCAPTSGECACSQAAVVAALSTTCYAVDPSGVIQGQCPGTRTCTGKGLTPCDAEAPSKELCDGDDDDCDGATDEDTCDDGNPCTTDACGGKNGCSNTPTTEPCDDGDTCTAQDACDGGVCAGKSISCDDGNLCTDDSCDKAKGCVFTNNAALCDDGDKCSGGDKCDQGSCVAGQAPGCDDNNVCTVDTCDAKTGACDFAATVTPTVCDDGDTCTEQDACASGKCVGAAVKCDDGDPCTDDSCDKVKGCVSGPNKGYCDDGDACTEKDLCSGGKCAGQAVKCDDGNPCTDDSCDKAKGCVTQANQSKCDDGDACTKDDVCAASTCEGAKIKCDDSNPCTDDTCDQVKGCVSSNNTAGCDDGDACTESDACANGSCAAGKKLVCDDGNVCTADSCDKSKGCVTKPTEAICDDGNLCTDKDLCKAGKCTAGGPKSCDDNDTCTTDSCEPKTGKCVYKTVSNCKGCTKASDCSDGNPCTTETCVNTKCQSVQVKDGTACDDGSYCTSGDACSAGVCKPGPKATCDDGNPCTVDVCDGANKKCVNGPLAKGFQCGTKQLSDDFKCTGATLYKRESFPGCTGSVTQPTCSEDKAFRSYKPFVKVTDCKLPNICRIENDKGFCGLPKKPSLKLTGWKLDKTAVTSGGLITITWTVQNVGLADSPETQLGLYRSSDATITTKDTYKGFVTVAAIPKGKTLTGTAKVALYGNLKPGKYYVGGIIDRLNKVDELDETDNTASQQVSVTAGPEIYVSTSTKPQYTTLNWGGTYKFYRYVRNYGLVATPTFVNRLWLSADEKIDKSDLQLFKLDNPALKPNAYTAGYVNFTMPKTVKPGTWYLIFRADDDDKVKEGNEANNIRITKITYRGFIDLKNDGITGPSAMGTGTPLKVKVKASNIGNYPTTTTFYGRIYYSKDTKFDKADIYGGYHSYKGAKVGEKWDKDLTLDLPKGVGTGTWYVLFVLDRDNRVKESNENNNVTALKLAVTDMANIRTYAFKSYSTKYYVNSNLSMYSYDRNYGTKATGKYEIRYYLSTDTTYDSKDTLIAKATRGPLSPNQSQSTTAKWLIPGNTKPGKYTLFCVTDATNLVKESNEKDNIRSYPVEILGRPDLVGTIKPGAAPIQAGSKTTVTLTWSNVGLASAGKHYDRVYLNTKKAPGGTYLGQRTREALAAGKSGTESYTFTPSVSLKTGTYWLVYRLDSSSQVYESDETNNYSYAEVKINAAPDFYAYYLYLSTYSPYSGQTVEASWAVRNSWYGTAPKTTVEFYLSKDAKWSADDTKLGKADVPSLKYNTIHKAKSQLKLPATATGTMYLLMRVDPDNKVVERYETNNFRYRTVKIQSFVDIAVTGLTVDPKSGKAGGLIKVTATHKNLGNKAGGFTAFLYLVPAKGDPIKLLEKLQPTVDPGKEWKTTESVVIPGSVAKGDYKLRWQAKASGDPVAGNNTKDLGFKVE